MHEKMLTTIKDGIHTIAIDDARYARGDDCTELIFVFCRGLFLEKVIRSRISVDGLDATETIIRILINRKEQYGIILTHGVTFGGFNVIDIQKIYTILKKPIISVTENQPTGEIMLDALKKLPNFKIRGKMMQSAGELYTTNPEIGKNNLYFHIKGISEGTAKDYLTKFGVRSRLPEPLFLAHKIASGIISE